MQTGDDQVSETKPKIAPASRAEGAGNAGVDDVRNEKLIFQPMGAGDSGAMMTDSTSEQKGNKRSWK